MKTIALLFLSFLLYTGMPTNSMAMETPEQVYQNAANEIIETSFKNPYYVGGVSMSEVLQKLLYSLDVKLATTLQQTGLPYQEHIKSLLIALIQATLDRSSQKRGYFSSAKETAFGSSNTVQLMGILKNVATNLNITLPIDMEKKLNQSLSYLHFYQGKSDFQGRPAFDTRSGTFKPLPPKEYPDSPNCITYVNMITDLMTEKDDKKSNRSKEKAEDIGDFTLIGPSVKNDNQEKPDEDIPPLIDQPSPSNNNNLEVDQQEPQNTTSSTAHTPSNNVPVVTQEQPIDWKTIDKTFQKGIMAFAREYKLIAGAPSSQEEYRGNQIIKNCAQTATPISNPEIYRRNSQYYNQIPVHPPLPGGTYTKARLCPPWMQVKTPHNASRAQGLKIHVSAKPETALKIAQIALPILHAKGMVYKVMYDLKLMRSLYYLSHYDNIKYLVGDSKSSQAGKFIAIYPRSMEEGQHIIAELDTAFQKNGLTSDDFVQLAGDAQIGSTGGIFARYGKFSLYSHKQRPAQNITPVNAMDESIPPHMMQQFMATYNPRIGLSDERIFPWPDYMNSRELYDQPLFGQLKVTWVNPYKPDQVITWDTRPNCWAELQGGKCDTQLQ